MFASSFVRSIDWLIGLTDWFVISVPGSYGAYQFRFIFRLVYNNDTDRTENAPGVQVRVSGFGNSASVEYLDASHLSICTQLKIVFLLFFPLVFSIE